MRRLSRLFAIALLPLSMIPFGAFLVGTSYLHPTHGIRAGGTTAWPSPRVTLNARRFVALPDYSTSHIPVLLWHGVQSKVGADGGYSVTPVEFANEMALLQHLGYHSISAQQYADWRAGKPVALPSRPVLLTFDDGRFDTWRGADQILAKYHMQATIFVIVGQVEKHNLFYLQWNELQKMERSGRWDIQFHADNGHVQIPIAKGKTGAFYAHREYYADGRVETRTHYDARITKDITVGLRILKQHGFPLSRTMAMPFGESSTGYLGKLLRQHFVTTFVQSGQSFTPYSSRSDPAAIRQEIRGKTTLDQMYRYLRDGNPSFIAQTRQTCKQGTYFHMTIDRGPICSRWKTLSGDKQWLAAHPGG